MSSIDLTVTSGIGHLRRRELSRREVQLGHPPKLIGGSGAAHQLLVCYKTNYGSGRPRLPARQGDAALERAPAGALSRRRLERSAAELRLDPGAAVRGGRPAYRRNRAPDTVAQVDDDDEDPTDRSRRSVATRA